MNSPQQTCNPDQIRLFLSGELTLAQEQSLQTHLDDCDTCRENMHSQAAEDSYWDEATQLFSDDGGYQELSVARRDSSQDEFPAGNVSLQTKSVLDMLAPTDDPNMLGRLGPYEVSGVIGAGGMGIVLKAFDNALSIERLRSKSWLLIWRPAVRLDGASPEKPKRQRLFCIRT